MVEILKFNPNTFSKDDPVLGGVPESQGGDTVQPKGDTLRFNPKTFEPENEAAVESALDVNPDTHARNLDLAKRSDLPVGLVEQEPDLVQRNLHGTNLRKQLRDTAFAKKWFANPDNAKIAHDDVDALTQIESLAVGIGEYGLNAVERGVKRVGQGYHQFMAEEAAEQNTDRLRGFGEIVDSEAGYETIIPNPIDLILGGERFLSSRLSSKKDSEEFEQEQVKAVGEVASEVAAISKSPVATQAQNEIMEAGKNGLGAALEAALKNPAGTMALALETGAEFAPQLAAGAGATILTRNPAAGAGVMGGLSGLTERYVSPSEFLQSKGFDLSKPEQLVRAFSDPDLVKEAQKYGYTRGMIIGAFDAVSGGIAGEALSKGPLRNFIYQAFVQSGLGGGGEATAQVATTGEIDAGEVVLEALAEFATAPIEVMGVGGQYVKSRRAKRYAETLRNMDGVESKLEARSPGKAAEFKSKLLQEQGIEQISIPAEQAYQLAQSDSNIEAIFDLGSDAFMEAVETGGDVNVSPVDYFTIPKESRELMIDHLRFGDDAMTAAEAADFESEGVAREFEDFAAEIVPENIAQTVDDEFVQRDIERQLVEAGQDPAGATLAASRYKERAARTNDPTITARSLYERDGLSILGPDQAKPVVDDISILLDKARSESPESVLGLAKTPMIDTLKAAGGIQPGGTLAAELNAIGVTSKTHPGLFKKGGMRNADNLVQSELSFLDADQASDTGYVAPDTVIDAVREEIAGNPRRSAEDQQRLDELNNEIDGLLAFLEEAGLDLNATEDAIRRALNADVLSQENRKTFDIHAENWRKALLTLDDKDVNKRILLGRVFPVLRAIGHKKGIIEVQPKVVKKIKADHPEVSDDIWSNLPELLADPLYAFESGEGTTSFVVSIDRTDANADPIVVAVRDGLLRSVYGKETKDSGLTGAEWVLDQLGKAYNQGRSVYAKEGLSASEYERHVRSNSLHRNQQAGNPRRRLKGNIVTKTDLVNGTFYQGPRGTFEPATNTIRLTEQADASTFLHEMGHKFLFDLKNDAQEFGANNSQLVEDWDTVRGWFGENSSKLKAEAIEYATKAKDKEAILALAAMSDVQVAAYVREGILQADRLEQAAFHGTPHNFDKFSLNAIGTGEGAQAFGWGMYFASKKAVANYYKVKLSSPTVRKMFGKRPFDPAKELETWYASSDLKASNYDIDATIANLKKAAGPVYEDGSVMDETSAAIYRDISVLEKIKKKGGFKDTGNLFQVDIPEDSELLDWDKPLSEQSESVQAALKEYISNFGSDPKVIRILGEDPTGSDIYELMEMLASKEDFKSGAAAKKASKALAKVGIPGLKYLDGGSRGVGEGSRNYVIWAEDVITVEAVNDELRQAAQTKFNQGGTTKDTSPQAYLTRAMNEQWARGAEDYFRTGQAPSIALAEAFNKFRAWLVSIYSAMKRRLGKDVLDVQFSPEVQAVMDRMLASDEEIELVRQQYNLKSFFSTAEEAGMTPKQFELYQRKVARSAAEMQNRHLKKHLNEIERTRKEWWTDEREKLREKIKEEIEARPEYVALYGLVRGTLPSGENIPGGYRPNRLDRNALLDVLGNSDSLQRLPRLGSKGVIATSKNEGSVHPDVAAQAYGYNSADEFLLALMNIEDMNTVIDRETDAAMKAEFGDMTVDGTAVEEALKAAHIDTQGEVMAAELAALSNGQSKLKPAFVRQWAKERIGQRKVDDIQPTKFTSVERKAAKEAGRLLRQGDRVGAARAKFKQMMNYYMAKEAYSLRDEIDKSKKYLGKFNKKKATFKKIDADYVDRIKEVLAHYSLGPRLSEGKILKLELVAFNNWLQEKETNEGAIFNIPQEILQAQDTRHYRDLTVDEYRTLVDAVKNIEAQGRLKKTAIINGETRTIDEIEREILTRVESLPTKTTEAAKAIRQDPSFKDKTIEVVHGIDAALRKTEFLLEYLDGEKLGPAQQAIFQTVADAEVQKNDIVRAVNVNFMKRLEALPKSIRKKLGRREFIPELGREMTRGNLIMMALNTGTESNFDKMVRGSKLDKGAAWTPEGISQAINRLTKEEWEFVQEVWNSFDSVYPKVQEIYRRENGVSPEAVEGRVIETPHGTVQGKYFPMIYDPRRSGAATEIEAKGALEAMQSTMAHASVFSGMTKARTNFAAPVLLDIEALPQQITKMAHYVSHYEPVRFLNRLINRKGFEVGVTEKLGGEYFKELKRWIGDIAADGSQDQSQTAFSKMVQALRTNVTVAIMGFSYTTGSAQLLGYSQSIDALAQGEGGYSPAKASIALAGGIKSFIAERGTVDKIKARSGEMRHRIDNIDRDVTLAMKRLSGKKGAWKQMQRASLYHIAYIQFYMVDVPTFIAAERQALKNGMDEAQAVRYADNIIRTSQTAGGLKDLSAFQKSKMMTPFSMFYSFFNLLYNVQARALGDTKKVRDVGKITARAAVLLALPTAMESLLRGEWPEDDENYAEWLALKSALYGASSVPLMRDFVGLTEGYDYNPTPISSIGKSAQYLIQKIARDYDEGSVNPDTIGKFGETIGYTIGVPVLQTKRAVKAFNKWMDGEDVDFIEYLRGPDRD